MNKQELIEAVIELPVDCSGPRPKIDKLTTLELVKLLDEPKKVVVPQFVADYIEKYKEELSIREAISKSYATFEIDKWLAELDEDGHFINQNTFALAWIDGYEVEKEKRYTVVMKETKQPLYYNAWDKKLFFSMAKIASHFTKQQLEKLNFGWVFDCPGIELEEVEE